MSRRGRIPFTSTFILCFSLAILGPSRGFLQSGELCRSPHNLQKSTLTSLCATIPKSKKKPRKRRVKHKASQGSPLNLNELSDHVSESYIASRHGTIGSKAMSRGIFDRGDGIDEQAESLKQLNARPALVLNADYQPMTYLPLSLWSWQEAVKAVFNGKVQVVDVYPDITVRAASLEIPLPSVIALTEYVRPASTTPAFTRRNVFLRDEYRCQYCGEHFHTADLSLDHVVPRSQGGVLSWDNAVTCCKKCNGRKGSTPVSQLSKIGMRLLNPPRAPTQMQLAAKAAKMVPKRVHPTWKPYIGLATTPSSFSSSDSASTGDEQFIDDRYFEE
ncbi:unnamed protein product [Cylindrotheca closterium]|uniref:HNH nuclease domain-containing protein n=1 Tax=Cylindrotheca closterium TaxID=2856 RepID=A0AAD2CWU3_9STRA|nr:unnamed protein product [Cylindrotheca closterium]